MSSHISIVNPEHFPRPRGYANGVLSRGHTLHIAGQIGWAADQRFPSDELAPQFAQALDNVIDVVRAAGGEPTEIVKMTVYVTDLQAYRDSAQEIGAAWRERLDKHFPAMALVGVAGLVEPRAVVEIEAVAVLAEGE